MPDDRRDGRTGSRDDGPASTDASPDDDDPAPDDDGSTPERSTDGGSARNEESSEQPTVSIGSEGFRPEEAGDAARTAEAAAETSATDAAESGTTAGLENAIPDADGEFDWRGWLLVAVVVVSFLVIPIGIFLRPLRLVGFQTTYLVLPLLPALVLGATAVWVAVRGRQGGR